MFISAAAPNKASLGATNGLSQLLCSIVRAIGPALTNSLFSLSIDPARHYLNGFLAYWVLVGITVVALGGSLFLPTKLWGDKKRS